MKNLILSVRFKRGLENLESLGKVVNFGLGQGKSGLVRDLTPHFANVEECSHKI